MTSSFSREEVPPVDELDLSDSSKSVTAMPSQTSEVNHAKCRYPHCIVWTPIPLLTWMFPFIGHMGICYTSGIIRDFAGPYFVSEDDMAFGNPTRFWQLDLGKIPHQTQPENSRSPSATWDLAIYEASEVYKHRMHNLCCDNCHSHVALALNKLNFDGSDSWNMVKLCLLMFWHGKYVGFGGFLKTWLPFMILASIIVTVFLVVYLQ